MDISDQRTPRDNVLIAFITFGEVSTIFIMNSRTIFVTVFDSSLRSDKMADLDFQFLWIGLESETFRVSSDRAGSSSHDAEGT